MPSDTYEGEVEPIRGDVFLDQILGWLAFVCTLPVLGFALYRIANPRDPAEYGIEPDWAQPLRVALIVLALIGIYGIVRSKALGFKIAIALFGLRLLGAVALYPYSGGPRFSGTEMLFDLVVIGYAWLRLRSLNEQP
jgi:hypothetical protein